MNQWDIIVINFPFTNLADSKIRPALIISNDNFNKKSNIALLAISTQEWNSDFAISLKSKDVEEWVLNKDSYVRMQNILSLEKRLIIKKVARISEDKLNLIKSKFIRFFE